MEKQADIQSYAGSCHGGVVQFEGLTALEPVARCNRSLRKSKGTLMSSCILEKDLRILLYGSGWLALYKFHMFAASHYQRLCDDAREPRFIKILCNEGYGFSAAVKFVEEPK